MSQVFISAAVEGMVDEAVVRRLIAHAGGQLGTVYGRHGKPSLREKIDGYNNAAKRAPWLVLVDLDHDEDCAPPLREAWIPNPAPHLCFRIAVREIEAWLLADAETLAQAAQPDGPGRSRALLSRGRSQTLTGAGKARARPDLQVGHGVRRADHR